MATTQQQQLINELHGRDLNPQEAYNACKANMDFFAGVALPHITEYNFPPVFTALWQILIDIVFKLRDFSKIAIGLPRGFGKTSVIKLFCLYCILFTNKQFILVFGDTATHAQNIIADIADMLDEDNIKAIFGNWRIGLEKDTQEVKKFGFRGRNIILAALGQGGSVRGLNIKNQRPDVMIFDDIQTREDAESPLISAQIESWMIGTAMKAASHKGCLYIFIANMYPTEWSLLKRLKANPEWVKIIVGGIKSDGTSLWEALKPIKQLLAEFRNDLNSGHPEIFYSEVLNDENASVNTNIDLSKMPPYPYELDEPNAGTFIVIDPSNDKVNSDAVSIGLFEILDGRPVIREIIEGRLSPLDTIKEALKLAVKSGTALILIEGNAYQYSLCFWFSHVQEQLGLTGIQALPIYSGSRAKTSRILDMFKALISGELAIHPDAMPQVAHQIIHFNALKNNNTDGILDLLTYATRVLTEFPQFIAVNSPFGNTLDNNTVLSIEENCCF
jgi:hypothetical protein